MRRRLSAIADYAQPVVFGLLAWLDAFTGFRTTAETEPEIVG